MFDVGQIQATLLENQVNWINRIEYFTSIDSSNAYLMQAEKSVHGHVCITDYQTQGKGRRGKQWLSSSGTNLMFSLGWAPNKPLGAEVSLAVGVAIADTLKQLGLGGVALKWPNDVLVEGAKLAGILLESRTRGKRAEFVIGIGLNIDIEATLLENVDTEWIDLARLGLAGIDRQVLLVSTLTNISMRLKQLEQAGFGPIRSDWLAYHALDGAMVRYELEGQTQMGKIIDLDIKGALLIETMGKINTVTSGEINTLREVS